MKTNLKNIAAAMAVMAVMPSVATAQEKFTVNGELCFVSDYVWRGADQNSGFSVQPSLTMSYAGFSGVESLDPAGQFNQNTYKKEGANFREMHIKIQKLGTDETQTVVIRQYAPIPVYKIGESQTKGNLLGFMERFEEYPTDDNTGLPIIGFPWRWENDNLKGKRKNPADNKDLTFTYSDVLSTAQTAENTVILSQKTNSNGDIFTPEGYGSAAHICYIKNLSGIKQGADVGTYSLPSLQMVKAMFEMSKQYQPVWGPFEPMHVYEDYWTSSVLDPGKNPGPYKSKYYNGKDQTFVEGSRSDRHRVRALFVDENSYKPADRS